MSPEMPPLPGAIVPASETKSNTLALISFFASLYPPVIYVLTLGSYFLPVLRTILGFMSILSLPALILAIVFGHIGLNQARRYAANKGYRGFAIAGLVIGYVELAVSLLFVVVIIYAVLHFS